MTIDNKTKRRAAAGIRAPVPDGTLAAGDRAAIAGIYPGERDDPTLPANLEDVAAELFADTALEDGCEATAAALFGDTALEDELEAVTAELFGVAALDAELETVTAELFGDTALDHELETVTAELFNDTALENEAEPITAELFVDTGSEVTMLGEQAGTIAWHFNSGDPDRNVKGVFEEVRRPQLIEGEQSREERADARLHLPYNDTDGVENPGRDDWVTVRGDDYDVLSIGSKQGGCRIIELVRTSRLHETASPVFGTL